MKSEDGEKNLRWFTRIETIDRRGTGGIDSWTWPGRPRVSDYDAEMWERVLFEGSSILPLMSVISSCSQLQTAERLSEHCHLRHGWMTELSQTSADCNPRATSSLRYTTLFALCPCSMKNIWGRQIDLSAKKLQSSWSIMRRISASCSRSSGARRKNQRFRELVLHCFSCTQYLYRPIAIIRRLGSSWAAVSCAIWVSLNVFMSWKIWSERFEWIW